MIHPRHATAWAALALLSTSLAVASTTRLDWALDNLHGVGLVPAPSGTLFLPVASDGLVSILEGESWRGFVSGALTHTSGFVLTAGSTGYSATGAVLTATADPMTLTLGDDTGFPLFRVTHGHAYRHVDTGRLVFDDGDLFFTPELAAAIGYPKLAGVLAGTITFDTPWPEGVSSTRSDPISPGAPCSAGFGPSVDLALTDMQTISQLARDPGNQVAISMDAHLANVGPFDVRWYWAIAPHGWNGTNIGPHPYLTMAYYREQAGVFRMIGQSDLKHAWNTINGDCGCPSGQVMYPGCTDIYGVGNNGNQYYFGPRGELTAHDGTWTSLGSHFDGLPVDDMRDSGASSNAFEHRLVVREADLLATGAVFYAQAWYLAALDTNLFNGIGYRAVTQELVGGTWAFSFTDGGMTQGSALNAWVDPASPAAGSLNRTLDTGGGHLQVAVKTWTNFSGTTHYEYAVMNLDYDRQVCAFTVPACVTAAVTNLEFNDTDTNPSNDWTSVRTRDHVTWTAPDGGGLDWGTMFNFRFDADVPPSLNVVQLNSAEPPDTPPLLEQSLAPDDAWDEAVRIVDLALDAAGGTTTWNTVQGGVYVLERTVDATPASAWTNVGAAVTAQTVTLSIPLPGATNATRLRVRQKSVPEVP